MVEEYSDLNFVAIQEPIQCPRCAEAGRSGFLIKMFFDDEHTFILPEGGTSSVTHRCNVCGFVVGVMK